MEIVEWAGAFNKKNWKFNFGRQVALFFVFEAVFVFFACKILAKAALNE